jgi:hypothetical protein
MIDEVKFMEPRILRVGEKVTGKCKDMKIVNAGIKLSNYSGIKLSSST